jgi:CheY-like chemotaxis protein
MTGEPREKLPTPLRVLLVEDNPDDALVVREQLESSASNTRFRVTHVSTLEEALHNFDERSFEVMLCDLGLPDTQGLETLAGARRMAGRTPVVVLTGRNDESLAIEAVRSGAEDYLVKGRLDMELLGRVLLQAVARHELLEELEVARARESFLATHDTLTSLPNRHLLLQHLAAAVAHSLRTGDLLGSRPSTTPWATSPAISCSSRSRSGCAGACAAATPWRDSAGTSSSSSCRTSGLPMTPRWSRRTSVPASRSPSRSTSGASRSA